MPASRISIDGLEPGRTALVAESSLTFGEVWSRSSAIARAIADTGLQAGDRVAVATSNRTVFYCCFAACFSAGYAVVVLDPLAAHRELELMLAKSKPAALVADEALLLRTAERSPSMVPDIAWCADAGEKPGKSSGRASIADIPVIPADEFTVARIDSSPAYIMFTSGTTSAPKAVVVSRHALYTHIQTLAGVFGYNDEARLLCSLPTHHTDGLVHGVAASLLTGMTTVNPGPYVPSMNLDEVLRLNRVSHFLVVPTILAMIKRTYGDREALFRYKEFRHLISTAGYLSEKLWDEFQDFFQVRVSNFYGMTETVSGTLYCGPDERSYRLGTLGKPVDATLRIVNEIGDEVATGTVGELQISGEHLMSGYLDDRASTAESIKDGWLSTGDIFKVDEDGFYHFIGRRKDIIKRGGITVYPEDVRKVVSGMPGVREVEVVGLPDPTFEQIIAVCAVADTGVSAEDIRAACREQLAPERRPDRVELMDSLPYGPSGKVQTEALIAMLISQAAGQGKSPAPLRERIIGIAAETFTVQAARLDESSSAETIEEWDSYAGIEFVLALEKEFAIRIRPRDVMRMDTIAMAISIVSAAVETKEPRA